MPYNDPDVTDPMTLHGVELETDDPGAIREMAACFIQELARDGWSEVRLLDMFSSSEFAGPTLAWNSLGREVVAQIIREELAKRGRRAGRAPIDRSPCGSVELPVLNS